MLFLLIVTGIAIYLTTREERRRALKFGLQRIEAGVDRVGWLRAKRGPFEDALRLRTPRLWCTPAIIAASAIVFVGVVMAPGSMDDPQTLVAWGANFGPLTLNGEWRRLVTAVFLHGGALALAINLLAIAQLGPILERQMGHSTFGAIFVVAGVFGSLMNLSGAPETVTTSGSAAVSGLYGLLIASAVRGVLQRSVFSLPLRTAVRLIPIAAVFAISNFVFGDVQLPQKAGLFTGFVSGLVLAKSVRDRKPAGQRLATMAASAVAIAAIAALPLRGVTDIRPELDLLVALEQRTAAAYDAAVQRFRTGRNNTQSMAQLIDGTILPELEAARSRVSALRRVPPAHQPLVAAANDYLRLRFESWRLRAEALGKVNMRLLKEADRAEQVSLAALEQIKTSMTNDPTLIRAPRS